MGHVVLLSSRGEQALEILRSGDIDLLLVDIEMPGMGGLPLLEELDGLAADPEVIMFTGRVDTEGAIEAIRRGASAYLTKPLRFDEVRRAIERSLQKRRVVLESRNHRAALERSVQERTQHAEEQEREVKRLNVELRRSFEDTLQALVTALDLRDNETQGHSRRVAEYAVLVAEKMGIFGQDLMAIRWGAILHDVGKIGVPDAILRKSSALTPAERQEMRKHPEMGHRMLQHISFLEAGLDIVLYHHERWDGLGYPRGLKEEEIPLGARIFALVDTLDAMTSDRPYRPAVSLEQARDEVRKHAGSQFDPQLAELVLSIPAAAWQVVRRRVEGEP
jgi:putative nucleotidyltransferase with HDIG domain